MERRISVRVATKVDIACRMPATPQKAILQDLSLDGCRIEMRRPIAGVGGTVVIDLNEWVSLTGTIVWCRGKQAGIRFGRRLDLGRLGLLDWIEAAEPGLATKLLASPGPDSEAA